MCIRSDFSDFVSFYNPVVACCGMGRAAVSMDAVLFTALLLTHS
jgi:hypothetical protein